MIKETLKLWEISLKLTHGLKTISAVILACYAFMFPLPKGKLR